MQPGRLYGVAISDIWASVFAALHISHSGIKLCQAHRPPGTARSDIGCHLYLQQLRPKAWVAERSIASSTATLLFWSTRSRSHSSLLWCPYAMARRQADAARHRKSRDRNEE